MLYVFFFGNNVPPGRPPPLDWSIEGQCKKVRPAGTTGGNTYKQGCVGCEKSGTGEQPSIAKYHVCKWKTWPWEPASLPSEPKLCSFWLSVWAPWLGKKRCTPVISPGFEKKGYEQSQVVVGGWKSHTHTNGQQVWWFPRMHPTAKPSQANGCPDFPEGAPHAPCGLSGKGMQIGAIWSPNQRIPNQFQV